MSASLSFNIPDPPQNLLLVNAPCFVHAIIIDCGENLLKVFARRAGSRILRLFMEPAAPPNPPRSIVGPAAFPPQVSGTCNEVFPVRDRPAKGSPVFRWCQAPRERCAWQAARPHEDRGRGSANRLQLIGRQTRQGRGRNLKAQTILRPLSSRLAGDSSFGSFLDSCRFPQRHD